jgi:hypothetical protein
MYLGRGDWSRIWSTAHASGLPLQKTHHRMRRRASVSQTEIKMIQRTLSRAALEADKAFKPAEPETTEYARTQQAFQDNRERLKMERLAREATVKR